MSIEYKDLPTGLLPGGFGWEKIGPVKGRGGLVTERQTWKRQRMWWHPLIDWMRKERVMT